MICLGCKLTRILNNEVDHNKAFKRVVAEHWLSKEHSQPDGSDDEHEPVLLSQLLSTKARIGAMMSARALDNKRAEQLSQGYDAEDGEWQREIKRGKGKLNWTHISPTIHQKDPNEEDTWNWSREDRLYANGRY